MARYRARLFIILLSFTALLLIKQSHDHRKTNKIKELEVKTTKLDKKKKASSLGENIIAGDPHMTLVGKKKRKDTKTSSTTTTTTSTTTTPTTTMITTTTTVESICVVNCPPEEINTFHDHDEPLADPEPQNQINATAKLLEKQLQLDKLLNQKDKHGNFIKPRTLNELKSVASAAQNILKTENQTSIPRRADVIIYRVVLD